MRKLIILLNVLQISVTTQFHNMSNQRNIDDFDDYIIPPNFFNIPKSFELIELPFSQNNELKTKCFTKCCFEWETRQVKTLFSLKDKSIHSSCLIYKVSVHVVEPT